ncbi:TEA domain-containing protein [Favolaschia claudopus]|uniref:TEA domain-containing protein n=1 Tax=Favolaschia claudopus TaxID=2862362 RepID=A0AAW0APF9_9AGAR
MDDSQPTKSLTPNRKHRKLLKDGSGTPVWPESIELLFVQGLREYWDSPWATYSRGRSRWRNQFLVDYLQNLGITRTKKQVASHIQVLRNMWKGEPEYHLVAGGEELFDGPVKLESPDTPHNLLSIEDHDDDLSSPDNSPPELLHAELLHDFPPSPAPGLSYSPSSPLSSLSDIDSPPHTFSNLTGPYSYAPNQKALAAAGYTAFAHQQHAPNPSPLRYPNRTASITLLAEGMTAFTINLDKLSAPVSLPSRTPPLTLHIRLSIPPVNDSRAPPNLHGFYGNLRLAAVWSAQAKVFTRVYDSSTGRCLTHEEDALHASSVELGAVVADLPESSLSRARWLDPVLQTIITQQVIVDNATLLFVVYDLDRRTSPSSALPSAELVKFEHYTSGNKPPSTWAPQQPTNYTTAAGAMYPAPLSTQTYTSNGYFTPPQPASITYGHAHPPPTTTTPYTPSLSSALTPVRSS